MNRGNLLVVVWLFFSIAGLCSADQLYWNWTPGDVYDVQLTTKTRIHVRGATQELAYATTTIIDGTLVVQSLSARELADVIWKVSRVRVESGEAEQRIKVDTDQPTNDIEGKALGASLRPLLEKQFLIRTNSQAALIRVQEQRSDSTTGSKPTESKQVEPLQLFTAAGVQSAFRHVFISFPDRDSDPKVQWSIAGNPLTLKPDRPVQFGYQYAGTDPQRGQLVLITGKYAFANPAAQGRVINIEQQQISGKLYVDPRQHYVSRLDLELLLKTNTVQEKITIKTEQSETQIISINKR